MRAMVEGSSERGQRPEEWRERAVRHPLHIPLRYRLQGQEEWSTGETLNMSESGLLFLTEKMLDVNMMVEITFQTSGIPLLNSSTRWAQIVRRMLSSWPETQPVFGAKFC